MNIQTIKHIIIYFLVFIMIIGLTSTFTAKEFIGESREVSLEGEDMLKMQVALNNGKASKRQCSLESNTQIKRDIGLENHGSDNLQDKNREVFEIGDSHDKILEYQKILFKLQYLKSNPDGEFGPMTQQAIINFQAKENLDETGKLDIKTQKSLEKAEELLEQNKDKTEQEQQKSEEQSTDSANGGRNIEHIVKANETLSQIGEKYNVPLKDIYQANNLTETSLIDIGRKIIIPQN